MKKIIYYTFLFMFASQGLVGCSSSDNEGGNEGGTNGNLITILKSNKWYCDTDFSYDVGDDEHIWADLESTTLYFTSDKNGVLYWIQKDYDSELGNNRTTDYTYFTYKISGNNVILEYEDGSTYTYKYKNNRLVHNKTDFYQSPLNYGDKDLIKRISPQTGSCGSSLNYAYYPKTHILEITGKGEMRDFTSKSQPWHDCYIEEVRIEEGCTSIGNLAFYESQYLTTVELPKTLKSIGAGSFAGSSITKVIIPDNVFYIKEGAFENCQYLKSVILGDGIEEIGDYAFCNCPVTKYLTLPENVTKVGAYAFMGWKLSGLTLNEKLKIIGNTAFYVKAKTISIPNSVESIGNLAFTGTFSNVTIGTGLKTLSRNAFDGSESGGNIYVNLGIPLKIADDGGVFANNQNKWNLYVPKGSIVAYKQSKSWNSFRNITEDASLISGNGTPNVDEGKQDEELIPKYNPKNLTYYIDGVAYKMILVTGGGFKPFYIMQTELPPRGNLRIGTDVLGPIDTNNDQCVIKYEFSQYMKKLRTATGIAFRLPTTAEWQYASKGGQHSKGYTYSGSNNLEDVAWYISNSGKKIQRIAQKKPNELGLYDMSGNYAEICNDTEDLYYVDGNLCGGNWNSFIGECVLGHNIKQGSRSGKIPGTPIRNKNAFDGRYETVRLVYTAP